MARAALSLRVRVIAVAVFVVVAPIVVIALAGLREQSLSSDMRRDVEAAVTARLPLASDVSGAEIAEARGVWLRELGADGQLVVDEDHDRGADGLHRIGQLFFGPDGAPTLGEYDATLEPLRERTARVDVPPGDVVSACQTAPSGKLLVCSAIAKTDDGRVLYAAESSRRAVRALYDLRYQVLRLTAGLLPFAIVVALLLGRGIVKPIRALGAQARKRAAETASSARLDEVGDREIRDLAVAFNELLAKLEERQRSNQAFTADLVHELKSPLATVRAAADAIGSGSLDEARAERLARALRDAGGRLDAIVTQFLELARAEGGLVGDERTPLRLAELVRRVAETTAAASEGATLSLELDDTLSVVGVAHGLDAVVRNLIENAFSFAQARGESAHVAITLRHAPPLAEGDDPRVELRVEDNGPGIAQVDLGRVFDRFFTSRGDRRGTGLGLALVKATVEAHGGAVRVESAPNTGATFVVELPLAPSVTATS